ncbi:hypothetical protein [Tenacibaculum sp. 190524A05c]|uniref:Natural product n=1 Tax=Tenacibaculum platacis TaxID=3137852 RepID=A0ABP1EM14_9FLAO
MLKDISKLGKTLDKDQLKTINGMINGPLIPCLCGVPGEPIDPWCYCVNDL